MKEPINVFIEKLSSKEPTPGGGGASALIGAIGVALCSMVANLTSGKKKYEAFKGDVDKIITRTTSSIEKLLSLIQEDAEAFKPLAEAYSIPKDEPGRDIILEQALNTACSVPLKILDEITSILDIIEELPDKGTKLAISDVGVAACACRAALEGAVFNVYINTKLMKDKAAASKINGDAGKLVSDGVARCKKVYERILNELR
ncbi:MAG: cyclodeaminase/cyclohydrolase family protein [Eubacteriales bacterium]